MLENVSLRAPCLDGYLHVSGWISSCRYWKTHNTKYESMLSSVPAENLDQFYTRFLKETSAQQRAYTRAWNRENLGLLRSGIKHDLSRLTEAGGSAFAYLFKSWAWRFFGTSSRAIGISVR
ncbi:MAG: hypothetical protein SGCHY_000238 [Lobulomycetales sp.]